MREIGPRLHIAHVNSAKFISPSEWLPDAFLKYSFTQVVNQLETEVLIYRLHRRVNNISVFPYGQNAGAVIDVRLPSPRHFPCLIKNPKVSADILSEQVH